MPWNYPIYCYLQELQLEVIFVVKNRQAIQDEVLDTTDRVEAIKDNWISSKTACKLSTKQKELIKEYQKDLTYKFKVLEKDFQTRMAVLQEEKQE